MAEYEQVVGEVCQILKDGWTESRSYVGNAEKEEGLQAESVKKASFDLDFSPHYERQADAHRDKAREYRQEARKAEADALADAGRLVDEWEAEQMERFQIRGDDIPEDGKLLKGDIRLSQADVNTLAERHADNVTFLRLLDDYCEGRGASITKPPQLMRMLAQREDIRQSAASIRRAVSHCGRWMGDEKGGSFIDTVFGSKEADTW